MSRYKSAGSYGHRIQKIACDHYRISWVVDRYYEGVRGRFPRTCSRDTDETGASRFKKRWNIAGDALPHEASHGG